MFGGVETATRGSFFWRPRTRQTHPFAVIDGHCVKSSASVRWRGDGGLEMDHVLSRSSDKRAVVRPKLCGPEDDVRRNLLDKSRAQDGAEQSTGVHASQGAPGPCMYSHSNIKYGGAAWRPSSTPSAPLQRFIGLDNHGRDVIPHVAGECSFAPEAAQTFHYWLIGSNDTSSGLL